MHPIQKRLEKEACVETVRNCLPAHIQPDSFIRQSVLAIMQDRNLQACSVESLYTMVTQCAQLGLTPGSHLGLAYFVPYGKTAKLIIGYKGLIELAIRSGEVRAIKAVCVYSGDSFEYEEGSSPRLYHKPDVFADHRGELIGCYARAQLKNGSDQFEVMSEAEIQKIKPSKSAIWDDHYGEMAKKTVIRRLCKSFLLSPEFRELLADDIHSEYPDQTPEHLVTDVMLLEDSDA